jgi:hypothetical protein
MSLIKRFFAWIGSLMRRRHFVASTTVISPPPPPPPGTGGAFLFNLAAQSGLLVILEDI